MYRALYRKWRPQRFEDVVGQRAIVTALKNQITAGRVGHAYLFTGVRGTGKTTCAKIFAKAVNCLHPHNGDPCGECEICKGIDNGSILDVVEMDAASNNGVDDIRDLRDETAYTPSACHYKVYIIDEVHMLSTAAFNALLKTLEEPPAHVIFILATTEIQKVPATILSRCQRYDFTRITADDIAKRLLYVAGEEKIDLDENAAQRIGRLADGAMRDALSILDTCAGVDNKVDEALVRRMAGVTDRGYLFEISDAINAHDSVTALEKIEAGELTPRKQDNAAATMAPPLTKDMARFDFTQDAAHIHNWVRGMNPWPVAWFEQDGKRIKVLECRLAENAQNATPGTVLALKPLTIAAANGAAAPPPPPPAGGPPMAGTAWAAGRRLKAGDSL